MQQFIKIFLITTIVILLLWLLPWVYRFATTTSYKNPFTLYSSVIHDFAMIQHGSKDAKYTDLAGNIYTENQFDAILPMFYYRQLITDGRFPNTLNGKSITPQQIQAGNFTFRIKPSNVNKTTIPLYPLLESMSGRVNLEMPDDVFRMNHRMEFLDMETNSIKEQKSELFTQMLLKKGFVFPAKVITGNATNRKEYDNGYLITDSNNQLFNVKMTKGRPYIRFIEKPDAIIPLQMFVTEFRNRNSLAFMIDTQQRFWVLTTSNYQFKQVEIPAFDPTNMSIMIIGNMLDWTISISTPNAHKLYAIDAHDYHLIKTTEHIAPEPTLAQKIGTYILPIQVRFISPFNNNVFPRLLFGGE